jgi:hypothetical protein
MADLDGPGLAALAADPDLPGLQVEVASGGVAGVVADPGQLGQPDAALECAYSAAGIAERIYARSGEQPMAGILLYTAAPDSEGTLGGPVSLGQRDRLGEIIDQALGASRLCSSDPLCAEHDPRDRRLLYGAACHACLFAAETSCERGNHYLDRRLLVDTVAGADSAFLPQ